MGKASGKRRHQASSLRYNSKVRDGVGRIEFFDFDVPLPTKQLREAMGSGDPVAQTMLLSYVSSIANPKILAQKPWTCTVCSRAAATRIVTTQSLYADRNLVVDALPLLVCRSSACEQDAHRSSQEMLREVFEVRAEGRSSDNSCGRVLAVLIIAFMLCCVIGAAVM